VIGGHAQVKPHDPSLHASYLLLRLTGGVGEAAVRHGPKVGRARRADSCAAPGIKLAGLLQFPHSGPPWRARNRHSQQRGETAATRPAEPHARLVPKPPGALSDPGSQSSTRPEVLR
jgi:hypothetical protein